MEASPQLQDWRNIDIAEDLLKDGYSDRLFFHTYEHALRTREVARELGKWCAYNGLEVDFYVLDWAALGHDYGYLEYGILPESVKQQYPSREKYAAAMVGGFMAMLGAPADKIQAVKEAIWSTEVNVTCTSLEGRILRQADLANVGNENQVAFFGNTLKLYREHRLTNNQSPHLFHPREFVSYALASYKLLSQYNAEDVSLGDFDRQENGRSLFCNLVNKNIPFLLPDKIKQLAQLAGSTLLKDIDLSA